MNEKHRHTAVHAVALSAAIGLLVGAHWLVLRWPLPEDSLAMGPAQSTIWTARHGEPLADQVSAVETRAEPIGLDAMSPHVVLAVLAAEDRRFFRHSGIDPIATARALAQNAIELRVVSGGSTVTQQLARLLLTERALLAGSEPPARTLVQKAVEARLALRLEATFDKDRILEAFLNRAPFGNLAVGIRAASKRYFGVEPVALSLAQAAYLAGLPRGPTQYDPVRRHGDATRRQRRILERMLALGMITAGQHGRAVAEVVQPDLYAVVRRSVHAVDLARNELSRLGLPAHGRVRLTLDARLQAATERIVAEGIGRVYGRGGHSAAAVVLDNESGDVLALVGAALPGNPIWGEYSAATAVRQPGSALKPFVYAAALEQGMTAATLAADIERPFPDTWGIYKPENYDGAYHGPVRLRDALAQSLNVAAVDVLSRTGLENAFNLLDRAGLKSLDRRPSYFGLGLTLGSGGVRLIDLANAYAALARGGVARPWRIVLDTESDGIVHTVPTADCERILDKRIAFIIADILGDPEARAPQFGERSILRTPYWTAVKTGTSKGYRDNWTIGFSDRFTVGVWVGDPAGRPMHKMSGAQGAGRMWRKVMNLATQHHSQRPTAPRGLERARVCAVSGLRIGRHCLGGVNEWFLAGTAPQGRCNFHRQARVDPENDLLVPDGCDLPSAELRSVTVYPSPFDAWAERTEVGRPEVYTGRCPPPARGRARLRLLSPAPTEMVRIDADAPRRVQALLLHAALEDAIGPVTFLVDGAPLVTVEAPHRAYWPVEPGRHAIAARHDRSQVESAVHWVEVY